MNCDITARLELKLATQRVKIHAAQKEGAMAVDPNATDCWCESVIFPEELLAQIPENAVRKTCVCQECLEKYHASMES